MKMIQKVEKKTITYLLKNTNKYKNRKNVENTKTWLKQKAFITNNLSPTCRTKGLAIGLVRLCVEVLLH